MQNKSRAFTLIELLVVVLIIGILAAVAVPQYEKAVAKSRAAGSFIRLRHLRDIVEAYYLANGVYPSSPQELGEDAPAGYHYVISNNKYIGVSTPNSSYMVFYILDRGDWGNQGNKWGCSLVHTDDGTTSLGAQICKQFCGVSSLTTIWGSGEKGCRFNPQ